MLCATMNNNKVELVDEKMVQDINELMSYDELLNELCCGMGQDLGNMTRVKDGIVLWYKEECEIEFIKVN